MAVKFNPFTGNLDFVNEFAVSDPLTLDNLTVNQLLTAGHIHGNLAGSVYIHVKNLDDEPLEKGAPFYISGTVGASDRVEVKRARADDPSRGPAVGLIEDTLAVNGEGNGVITGEIFQYDTDTPNWETNQPLYVSAAGTLTNVRPATGYRQIVGYVGRIQSSTGTIIVAGGKKEAVAGSDTQIQFNDDGGFGASADLTWDDTAKELGIGGDINLDDGGSFTTTVQCVTPTANRTISFPDKTGTVALVAGSSGQVLYNSSGANAGLATVTTDGTNITLTGRFISSLNGAASAPPGTFTGTWFTGGTATTTKPQVLIEPAGTTSASWSTSGTGLGVNAASGFAGNLLDLQVNGTSNFQVSAGIISKAYQYSIPQLAGGSGIQIALGGGANGLYLGSDLEVAWSEGVGTGTLNIFSSPKSLRLARDAANTLAQRNGTNAQTFRLYNTYTDASNYERHSLSWSGNVLNIANEAAGTGNLRSIAFSANAAADTPPVAFTGSWFTGGTTTTTKPHLLIEPAGTTSASWSTSGTGLGVNAPSGFAGNLIDFQVNGTSRFRVANNGDIFGNTVSTSTAGLAPATSFSTITYGATVALDFASLDAQYRTINLTGDLELTTSNLANGRTLVLRIVADATQRTFTFPVDWKFVSTKPATLAASKTAILSLTAFGSTNADVIAAYAFQP